jgi:hypothetical protein
MMKRTALAFLLVAACSGAAHAQALVSDYYSLNSLMNGAALAAGTVIEARDGNGTLCGSTVVNPDGTFLLHVYGDDPQTTDVDEGASPGEFLQWRIDSTDVTPASVLWIANLVGNFNDMRWEDGAAKQFRMVATSSAIGAKTWTAVKDQFRP